MRFPSMAAALALAALLASTAARADDPAPVAAGVVKLHVESPTPVQVFEHVAPPGAAIGDAAALDGSRLLCTSPCDRVITFLPGQRFSARGDFPGEKSFTLDAFHDSVSLDVSPGSNARRTWGIATTTLGGVGVLAGASLFLLPSAVNSGAASCVTCEGGKTSALGVLVGGGVALLGGIVLLATSGTSWTLHPTAPAQHARARFWLGEL